MEKLTENFGNRFIDPMKVKDVEANGSVNGKKSPKPKILWFNPIIAAFFGPVIIGAFIFSYTWIYSTNQRVDNIVIELTEIEIEIAKNIAEIKANLTSTEKEIAMINSLQAVELALKRIEVQINEQVNNFNVRIIQLENRINKMEK